jgi:hypothetical protein
LEGLVHDQLSTIETKVTLQGLGYALLSEVADLKMSFENSASKVPDTRVRANDPLFWFFVSDINPFALGPCRSCHSSTAPMC